MKRLALFAHYDRRAEVKRYVVYHLRALREVCDAVWFVSTAELSSDELAKTRPFCERAWTRENRGYDFGMWREAIERTDLRAWDELVLTNSSVFGPLWPLGESFEKMGDTPCDLWSMTDNVELGWHLQSYFLVCRKRLLESAAFGTFWASVLPFRDKDQVIRSYEVGFSQYLVDEGFRATALVPLATLPKRPLLHRLLRPRYYQPTTILAPELIARRMPYVKLELLRDNPMHRPLAPVRRAMARAGYDMDLVELEPRPRRS